MKEIPIIFSTEMVKAILEGRKTQTRRILNPQPEYLFDSTLYDEWEIGGVLECNDEFEIRVPGNYEWISDIKSQYGHVEDRLYVREKYRLIHHYGFFGDTLLEFSDGKIFRDGTELTIVDPDQIIPLSNWKPSIHMPKIFARIWLEITDIRVERLQEISEEDAENEGVLQYGDGTYRNYFNKKGLREQDGVECLLAKGSFQSLWDSINDRPTKHSTLNTKNWNANPWVWVICFKVLSTTGKPELRKEVTA